jgi:hypothetical protein
MCRSIKVLRRSDTPVTSEEISAAALQFVRKVSGFHKPSKTNQAAFDAAVHDIATVTENLLKTLAEGTEKGRNRTAQPEPAIFSQP